MATFCRVAIALALFYIVPLCARAADTWATWHTSSVALDGSIPVFSIDGKPFFVYGAAFFYERTPRAQWRDDLLAYKRLGINTIDLYLIWNWHEPDAQTKDFTGATNPRRDLPALFTMLHELGFKIIVRPGPVIRNEWRNGGYPDWLLERPEYDMPLHEILEGRYPATATYQNVHADAAAAEWLNNSTHLTASAQWLHDVLHAIEPWSHDVIAIALDDDQGAYIDNDTWPAPHWHRYIDLLRSTVQATVGPAVPLFLNTYQMKITAAAPAWAWGNWYQSDADVIGNHDIAQLAFSTALLQTQPGLPVMASEFQAGWLQGAADTAPRASLASNTTIALHELLQYGAHGVVNFPLADTLNPAGWEAPWTNRFYAWNAAFTLQGTQSPRGAAVNAFGALLAQHGADLATMQPQADVAIAWLPSAYDAALVPNDRIARLADLTIAALQRCRALARTCRLVDLRFDTPVDLARTPYLVMPQTGFPMPFLPEIEQRLSDMRAHGVHVEPTVDAAVTAGASSATHGIADAALLVNAEGSDALLDVFNATGAVRAVDGVTLHVGLRDVVVAPFTIPAFSAHDVWIDESGAHDVTPTDATATTSPSPSPSATPARAIAVSANAWIATPAAWRHVAPHRAIGYAFDAYDDGFGAYVLDNGLVRAVIVPDAGARVFALIDLATNANLATTIGAARDDVQAPPTPSPRDYIAQYTHPLAAGTFNRPYQCAQPTYDRDAVRLTCTYDAPDLAATPVHFQKTFALRADSKSLEITLRASAPAVSLSAIAPDGVTVAWPDDSQTQAQETPLGGYRLERLAYPPDRDEEIIFTAQGAKPEASNRP